MCYSQRLASREDKLRLSMLNIYETRTPAACIKIVYATDVDVLHLAACIQKTRYVFIYAINLNVLLYRAAKGRS